MSPNNYGQNVSIVGIVVNQMPMTIQVLLEISYVSGLNYKQLDTHGCVLSIIAIDVQALYM